MLSSKVLVARLIEVSEEIGCTVHHLSVQWKSRMICAETPAKVVKLASPSGRKSSNCILPECVFLYRNMYISNSISKSVISSLRFSFLKMAPCLNLDAKCHHVGIPNREGFNPKDKIKILLQSQCIMLWMFFATQVVKNIIPKAQQTTVFAWDPQ